MKIRIRYMYENGNTPMLEMLLSASSFSDFLNRTEYISEINSYDRQKLEEFIQVQEQIAAEEASLEEQKKDLESEQQELLAMQDDMKVKQNSVNSLISSTQANISQTNSELSSAQEKSMISTVRSHGWKNWKTVRDPEGKRRRCENGGDQASGG